MALRSALASLPARLRATPAATAAGGWRRLLSDDPKDGRPEDTLKAQNEKNILKEQVDKSNKEIKELKDQIERAETEKQLLKYQIQKNEKNCLKDQLEDSRKEIKQLKDQHDNAETESQLLKDQILKDLETTVRKQTAKFESKLANDRMLIDESVREMQIRSEKLRDLSMSDHGSLRRKCSRRADTGEQGTTVLAEKNVAFQDGLIRKVQQAQYSAAKIATTTGVVIGGVVFLLLRFM